MIQSGVNEGYKKHYIKVKIGFIISSVLLILSICLLIYSIILNDEEITFFIASILSALILMLFPATYGSHFVRINRYKNIVGENLTYEISELGIKVFDTVDFRSIEKEFYWSDMDYIHKVCYTSYATIGKYFYGLEFVIDEKKFHEALSMRQKKAEYNQRDEELNYGFFVICDRDYWDTVKEYYGKEIR